MKPITAKKFILAVFLTVLQGCGGGSSIDSFSIFWAVIVTDLDQDSVADIAVTSTRLRDGGDRQYAWTFLNQSVSPGNLTRVRQRLPGGDGGDPTAAAVGDLNQDGLPDIATFNDGAVVALFQDAARPGQFFDPATLAVVTGAVALAIGDLNQDGVNDLAIARGSSSLSILLQDALNPGLYVFAADPGTASSSVAIGDLDGDLINDLAIGVGSSGQIRILIQDAGVPATFSVDQSIATGAWTTDVKIEDLDQDGAVDLIVSNSGNSGDDDGSVSILLQDLLNPGQFLGPVNYGLGCNGGDINVGDLNADGFADIAVASRCRDGRISLLFQDLAAPGTFTGPAKYATDDGNPWAVAIGDVNDDGFNDLAISEGSLYLRYQDATRPGQFLRRILLQDDD